MEGTKVSLVTDSTRSWTRAYSLLSVERQIPGIHQRDFRYSMIAQRSSGDNAGPITPLPRGHL